MKSAAFFLLAGSLVACGTTSSDDADSAGADLNAARGDAGGAAHPMPASIAFVAATATGHFEVPNDQDPKAQVSREVDLTARERTHTVQATGCVLHYSYIDNDDPKLPSAIRIGVAPAGVGADAFKLKGDLDNLDFLLGGITPGVRERAFPPVAEMTPRTMTDQGRVDHPNGVRTDENVTLTYDGTRLTVEHRVTGGPDPVVEKLTVNVSPDFSKITGEMKLTRTIGARVTVDVTCRPDFTDKFADRITPDELEGRRKGP
jgi:hypothetical protein